MSEKKIIATEKAISPAGPAKGKRVDSILFVLYDDGTEGFKCAECDYSGGRFHNILGHLSAHRSRPKPASDEALATLIADIVTEYVNRKARTTSGLRARVQAEKKRADDAEKALHALRDALRGVQ